VKSFYPLSFLILLLGLYLRLPWPLPAWWHYDERIFMYVPLLLGPHNGNPGFFCYPSPPFYLLSLLSWAYWAITSDTTRLYYVAYQMFVNGVETLRLGRCLSTAFAVGTVGWVLLLGRRLYGEKRGLLAGVALAVLPLHVRFSHLALVDAGGAFFLCGALYWSVTHLKPGGENVPTWRSWALGGVWVALAASWKYPLVLGGVAPLTAWWFLGRPRRGFGWMAAGFWVVFLIGNPYLFWGESGWGTFVHLYRLHVQGPGHHPETTLLVHHARHTLFYGITLGWLGLLVIGSLRSYDLEEFPLLVFVLAWVAFLLMVSTGFMRYAVPLAPPVALFLGRSVRLRGRQTRNPAVLGVILFLFILGLGEAGYSSWRHRTLLGRRDTRLRAYTDLAERYPHLRQVVRLPDEESQFMVFNPRPFYRRAAAFVWAYSYETLGIACEQLASGPPLPPFYGCWEGPTENIDAPVPQDTLLVLHYRHILYPWTQEDAQRRDRLEPHTLPYKQFLAEHGDGGVYETLDYYFLPLAGDVERPGPNVEVGFLPVANRIDSPTGQMFFGQWGRLIKGL